MRILVAAGIARVAALERLQRIAHEVEHDAEELFGIGIHHQPALDRADPAHRRAAGIETQRLPHVLDQGLERDRAAVGRRLLHAAVGQCRLAERDGALERAHELGCEALHMRIGDLRQPLGEQLRRGQQVAQVVVDLRHRQPERGEMVLLLQHRGDVELHGGQLALGGADLVEAVRRRDNARGIFRVGAERHHVGGHAPHRPHQQHVQREVDERGGDRGDEQRQQQDPDREFHHRLA